QHAAYPGAACRARLHLVGRAADAPARWRLGLVAQASPGRAADHSLGLRPSAALGARAGRGGPRQPDAARDGSRLTGATCRLGGEAAPQPAAPGRAGLGGPPHRAFCIVPVRTPGRRGWLQPAGPGSACSMAAAAPASLAAALAAPPDRRRWMTDNRRRSPVEVEIVPPAACSIDLRLEILGGLPFFATLSP